MSSAQGYIVLAEDHVDDFAPRRFAVLIGEPTLAILKVLDSFPELHCRILRSIADEEVDKLRLLPGEMMAYDN